MNITKGQIVTLNPEVLDPGEANLPHVAMENSFNGTVKVQAVGEFPGIIFKPVNIWRIDWIAADDAR